MVAGDLWINNESNQIYFFDGTDTTLAGPIYNQFQGRSGPEVVTVLDNTGTSRTIVKYWIGNTLVGLWSKIPFTPQNVDTIPGFTRNVVKGFNVVDDDFIFAGTAEKTSALVDSNNVTRTAAQFLASDSDDETSGALKIINNDGLTVGLSENHVIKVDSTGVVAQNAITNQKYQVQVRASSGFLNGLVLDPTESKAGIYVDDPAYTLDVGGDLRVAGDFIVEGETVSIGVEELLVKDKSITLARASDSTLLDDTQVDQAGIIVSSSGGDKELLWRTATNAWTSNVSLNLTNGSSLKFDGVDVITGTAAPGLTSIGALTSANIGNFQFAGGISLNTNTADGQGNGANLNLAGNMNFVTARQIKNVSDPTDNQDVATKNYVDSKIDLEVIPLTLDVTGIGTEGSDQQHSNIATILQDIAPAGTKRNGTEARVHCTTTTGATATLTGSSLDSAFNESNVVVQALDGNGDDNGSISVIGSATFNDVTGSISSTVTRTLKLFRIVDGEWQYVQDLTPGVLV